MQITRKFLLCLLAACPAVPGADSIQGPLVISDRWPQSTTLAAWTRDVMRLEHLENATETAQGKAFFTWLRLFSRMATGGMIQAYEGARGAEKYVTDAHKNLFVYGWGYCDTTSRIAEAAWTEYKKDPTAAERVCVRHENGGYHTMYRLRLDGKWGAFDPRYGYYLIESDAPGARVLDWTEVGNDANIHRNRAYTNRSRPFFEFFGVEWERALLLQPAFFATEEDWVKAGRPDETVFGNRMYRPGTRYHDMDFVLPRGAIIERFWDNSARKFYVPAGSHTKREEAFLPAGRFYRVTDSMFERNWSLHDPNYPKAAPYLSDVPRGEGYDRKVEGGRTIGQSWGRVRVPVTLRPGEVFDYYSPYILVDGTAQSPAPVEIRTLEAKPLSAADADRWSEWSTLEAGILPVHGVYQFQLRSKAAARADVTLHFENGIMTLPQIFAGSNTVRFQLRDDANLRGTVLITYRYQTAQGEKIHEQRLGRADFHANTATYSIEAPGLVRCRSIAIQYE